MIHPYRVTALSHYALEQPAHWPAHYSWNIIWVKKCFQIQCERHVFTRYGAMEMWQHSNKEYSRQLQILLRERELQSNLVYSVDPFCEQTTPETDGILREWDTNDHVVNAKEKKLKMTLEWKLIRVKMTTFFLFNHLLILYNFLYFVISNQQKHNTQLLLYRYE